jgi:lysophospholipase L1-like esterase
MKREWAVQVGLIMGAILLTLGALEIGLRLSQGGWITSWPNFVLESRKVQTTRNESRYVEDPTLGYVPRANYSADGISFDADGFRRSAATTPDPGAILAVGDSFTYGEEVEDAETWPAHLQQLLGERVLNAGVSGYGFDQIVLRAEKIVPEKHPSAVVVSFIADDVLRTEMRRQWSAEKPYFDIENGALVPRNVPVPPRPDPRTTLGFLQRTLGYSFLFDFIMRRLHVLHDWYGDHVRAQPAGTGEKIACLLTRRLAELQSRSGARILVVAQYDPVVWQDARFAAEQRRLTEGVLACSRQQGLDVLDSFDALVENDGKGKPATLYGLWHMNDAGNRLVARLIAAALGNGGH